MNRSRITGDLVSQNNIFVDIANDRVGIGSTIPGEKLSLSDNAKIALGNSADLQIYHDGNHSFLQNTTGLLILQDTSGIYLRTDDLRLQSDGGSETYATLTKNGAVSLNFDNNNRFQTKDYGVEVIGTTDTDGLVVSGVSTFSGDITGTGDLTLTSTDAGAAAAPTIDLVRNSSSPADNDLLGQLRFSGKDDQGSSETYAYITGKILDASAGGEDGILEFTHRKNSSFVITGRWRSDSLQLLNGTNFSVAGNLEVTGTSSLGNTVSIDTAQNEKLVLRGSSDPYIRFKQGTNDKAYIQWDAGNATFLFVNQASSEQLKIASGINGLVFRAEDTNYTVWHGGNDGTGSGLDADLLDGVQGSSFLRSDTADTASGDITFSGGAGAITLAADSDIRFTNSSNWTGDVTGKIQLFNNVLYISGGTSGIIFREAGTSRWRIDGSGHFRPEQGDGTLDIGTNSVRVRNGYFDTLYGDGSNITAINASNISSGTISDARLPSSISSDITGNAATATAATRVTVTDQSSDTSCNVLFTQSATGNQLPHTGTNLTFNSSSGLLTATSFSGNGANITNVNATTLDSIDSGSFLRSDANDTTTGIVNFTSSSQYPININSSADGKIVLQGSSNPYIRFRESGTDKAYVQWNSNGNLYFVNQETGEQVYIGSGGNGLKFVHDGTISTVWHSGNDGTGTGLDADTVDGIQGASFLRSDAADTATGDISFGGGGGAVTINGGSDIRFTSGNWTGNTGSTAKIQAHANYLYIVGGSNGIIFREDGTDRSRIDGDGHFRPASDSTYDLGLTGTRWRNVYADTLYGDGSNLTGIVGVTINGNVNNRIVTASGTTGTLNGESNFTYDGSQVVLTGTTDGVLNLNTTDSRGSFIRFQQGGNTKVWVGSGQGLSAGTVNDLGLVSGSGNIVMNTNGATRAILDTSGNLFLRSAAANYVVLGTNGAATSGGVNNNMNWIRGNQGNTQYNTSGGFHAWEISGTERMNLSASGNLEVDGTITAGEGTGQPFFKNKTAITTNTTIDTTYNWMSAGPITINSGVTVTVNSGATWTVV